jgi:hypothetical protein
METQMVLETSVIFNQLSWLIDLGDFINFSRSGGSRDSDWLRTGRPRGRNSSLDMGTIFSFSRLSDRFWGPPIPISDAYQGLFPKG